MKTNASLAIILLIIGAIVVVFLSNAKEDSEKIVYLGNKERKAIDFPPNVYKDVQCGMVISSHKYAAQAVDEEGKTLFFDDVGCLAEWLRSKKEPSRYRLYVFTNDTARWIDARKAHYSRTEKTPMHYGFGAYEMPKEGLIDFKALTLFVLRNETLNNPYTKRELLGKH